MSLDVYLYAPGERPPKEGSGIFVREDEQTKEISREEWDRKFPGREPVTFTPPEEPEAVFSANITHNLGCMAGEAGIYQHLWRPEELNITQAKDLIEPLKAGLARMKADPERFRQLEPENKWGTYDIFVPWIEEYLEACKDYPEATIQVSR